MIYALYFIPFKQRVHFLKKNEHVVIIRPPTIVYLFISSISLKN